MRKTLFVLVVAAGLAPALGAPAAPRPLRAVTITAAGTNYVDLASGEVYGELWRGRITHVGRVVTRGAGWVAPVDATRFSFHGSFVAVSERRPADAAISNCSGEGTVTAPDGDGHWTCRMRGGTGRFAGLRGTLTVDVKIHRLWIHGMTQKNRLVITARGRISV